ncbi:MAG: hypothetical protein JRH19_26490 [Deltaproteobacteria bacterium]|nr:hypothetical protein [Deltaproteobacteria bacterium]
MAGWMGWPGLLLGIVSAPGAVVFPFVSWYVEGVFPTTPFVVWALSVCGIAISMAWKSLRPR